jgi:predicted nucleic acid-binding protein
VRRRAPELLGKAIDQVEALSAIYIVAPTDARIIRRAGSLSLQHRLQFWDAVIWIAVREAGACVFLSEDLQDGFNIEGMYVLNPFSEHNQVMIRELLDGGNRETAHD